MAILYVFMYRNQESTIVKFLSIAPLVYLGTISYGFYLYHNFLRIGFVLGALEIHPNIPNKMRVAIEFAATLIVASASWRYIEQPILKFAKSRAAIKL
jgi:peptidoglycan/LPS O-acetylase OafA/YrhL